MDRKFKIDQLDQERLIKNNDLPMVTNPVIFNAGNGPTSDGLLSNELFGITKDERSGIFGYIDLKEGSTINQGTIIGTSGTSKINTNYTTSLHFEVYYNGELMDPENFYTLNIEDL